MACDDEILPSSLTKKRSSSCQFLNVFSSSRPLWDSISPNELRAPDAHKAALDHSLAEYERDPESGRSWDQLRDDLRK
jgi:putative addiction module component (TIGR02574 family)